MNFIQAYPTQNVRAIIAETKQQLPPPSSSAAHIHNNSLSQTAHETALSLKQMNFILAGYPAGNVRAIIAETKQQLGIK